MMVQCWSSKCFIISGDKSAPLGNTKSPVVKLGFLRYAFHITSTSNKDWNNLLSQWNLNSNSTEDTLPSFVSYESYEKLIETC